MMRCWNRGTRSRPRLLVSTTTFCVVFDGPPEMFPDGRRTMATPALTAAMLSQEFVGRTLRVSANELQP